MQYASKDGAMFTVDLIGMVTISNPERAAASCRNLSKALEEYVLTEVRNTLMELQSDELMTQRGIVEERIRSALVEERKGTMNLNDLGVTLRVRVQSVVPSDSHLKLITEHQQNMKRLSMQKIAALEEQGVAMDKIRNAELRYTEESKIKVKENDLALKLLEDQARSSVSREESKAMQLLKCESERVSKLHTLEFESSC